MTSTDTILQDTINAMQALHRSVTDIATSPPLDQYPTVLDTGTIPYILTWPGPATWHHEGQGGAPRRQDRTMFIVCYLRPLGQNDIPSRAVEGALVLQRMIDLWLDTANIALHQPTNAEPWQTTIEESDGNPHSDEGLVSNLMFRGIPWEGFQLSVRVRIKWGIGTI